MPPPGCQPARRDARGVGQLHSCDPSTCLVAGQISKRAACDANALAPGDRGWAVLTFSYCYCMYVCVNVCVLGCRGERVEQPKTPHHPRPQSVWIRTLHRPDYFLIRGRTSDTALAGREMRGRAKRNIDKSQFKKKKHSV